MRTKKLGKHLAASNATNRLANFRNMYSQKAHLEKKLSSKNPKEPKKFNTPIKKILPPIKSYLKKTCCVKEIKEI